ncbi:hypothetical protein [Acinetobacter ursingii]|uniref:hypothetical protein n=1 Tax=Acinetobacter ursingii TaxID=108980 RepID=UPI00124FDC16|nr:hypothetical protein [Acinetobacter ursingii]
MKKSWMALSTLCICFSLFSACTTTGWKSKDLNAYLQQFVGQSTQQVQQTINLKSMGYQTTQKPILTSDQLTYTVIRSLNIPTPTARSFDGMTIQTGASGANSYNLNIKCDIVFLLKNNVVQSYQYQGRAC